MHKSRNVFLYPTWHKVPFTKPEWKFRPITGTTRCLKCLHLNTWHRASGAPLKGWTLDLDSLPPPFYTHVAVTHLTTDVTFCGDNPRVRTDVALISSYPSYLLDLLLNTLHLDVFPWKVLFDAKISIRHTKILYRIIAFKQKLKLLNIHWFNFFGNKVTHFCLTLKSSKLYSLTNRDGMCSIENSFFQLKVEATTVQ